MKTKRLAQTPDLMYAIVTENAICILGFDEKKAKAIADDWQYDLCSYDYNKMRAWGPYFLKRKRKDFRVEQTWIKISRIEAEALLIIGKSEPNREESLEEQIKQRTLNLRFNRIRQSIDYSVSDFDLSITGLIKNEIDAEINEFLTERNAVEYANAILDKLREKNIEITLDNAFHLMMDDLKTNEEKNKSILSVEHVFAVLEEIINKHCGQNLDQIVTKNTSTVSFKKDIRNNSVDPKVVRLVERWQKRCDIFDSIKENDILGLGKTQREIAKEQKSSVSTVNLISQMYAFDNNLSHDDLWERKRGVKPDPFKIIPIDEYAELTELLRTKGPMEVDLPFNSWCAAAIYYYLHNKNIDVTLSYVYAFCRRENITLKSGSRKNPKENHLEVEFLLEERFHNICKKAILKNAKLLYMDECHVMIYPNFKGYSLANTPSIISYDASVKHSYYSNPLKLIT